jgi:hypothetical protein
MFVKKYSSIFLVFTLFTLSCDKDSTKDKLLHDVAPACNGSEKLCDKTLIDVSMVMTHNAFNVAGRYLIPNQDFSITRQLNDGVRGLMIDVYSSSSGPVVYHGFPQTGSEPLRNVLLEIKRFMDARPNEVIVIIYQNSCPDEDIIQVMDEVGLKDMAYIHNGTWPTLSQMIKENKRLVSMLESSDGDLPAELLYAWEHTFDTPYSFTFPSDFNCNVNRGGSGKRTFYLVNHWLSSPVGLPDRNKAFSANGRDVLGNRIDQCTETAGRRVNFVGVDFYNLGQVMELVNRMNGIVK